MKQKMSKEEYGKFVKQQTPPSKLGTNCIKAFLVGGAICVLGEALMTVYKDVINLPEKTASTLVSVTLIFIASLLTALNIYPSIAKFAGAGTLVPITGFSNSVTAPALESKTEGYVRGVGAKIFTIAGPVILYGSISSVIAGIVIFFIS